MKYKLKENIASHQLTVIDLDVKEKLLQGKEVELDVMPRCLIGKVDEVKQKQKKLKKEND
jgi:hypothetical protein